VRFSPTLRHGLRVALILAAFAGGFSVAAIHVLAFIFYGPPVNLPTACEFGLPALTPLAFAVSFIPQKYPTLAAWILLSGWLATLDTQFSFWFVGLASTLALQLSFWLKPRQ